MENMSALAELRGDFMYVYICIQVNKVLRYKNNFEILIIKEYILPYMYLACIQAF